MCAAVATFVREDVNRAAVLASLGDDRAIRGGELLFGIMACGGVPGETRTRAAARPAPPAFCRQPEDPCQ